MQPIPEVPCRDCPWRVGSPRFVRPIEWFNDVRIERLGFKQSNTAPSCLCFAPNNATCETVGSFGVQMRPARTSSHSIISDVSANDASVNDILFPSFEAMADANGAGLYDWTAQLTPGDVVVHFLRGVADGILEVSAARNGIVQAGSNALTHRFNALGYEMKCVADSRILPATRATLENFVLQPDPNETHRFV